MKGFALILTVWLGLFLAPAFAQPPKDAVKEGGVQVQTTYTITVSEKEATQAVYWWIRMKYKFEFPDNCTNRWIEVTRSPSAAEWEFVLKCREYN